MIAQLKYTFRRQPTRELLEKARNAFVAGKTIPGVLVEAIVWRGTEAGLKAAIQRKTAYIGNAGIVKQLAGPRITLCDLDGDWRPSMGLLLRVARMLDCRIVWMREDKTKNGWHLVICWSRTFKPAEQIAIQCILGSDRERETYNLARVLTGKKSNRWNLLFERKIL